MTDDACPECGHRDVELDETAGLYADLNTVHRERDEYAASSVRFQVRAFTAEAAIADACKARAQEERDHEVTRKLWDSARGMYSASQAENERLRGENQTAWNKCEELDTRARHAEAALAASQAENERLREQVRVADNATRLVADTLAASQSEVERLRKVTETIQVAWDSAAERAERLEAALREIVTEWSLPDTYPGPCALCETKPCAADCSLVIARAALSPALGEGEVSLSPEVAGVVVCSACAGPIVKGHSYSQSGNVFTHINCGVAEQYSTPTSSKEGG